MQVYSYTVSIVYYTVNLGTVHSSGLGCKLQAQIERQGQYNAISDPACFGLERAFCGGMKYAFCVFVNCSKFVVYVY